MGAGKTGRNDPCPCGSDRKYKHCCGQPGRSGTGEPGDDLKSSMAGREFADEAEVQAFAGAYMQRANATGLDDFDGLSPTQMSDLLYAPLDSPQRIEFVQSGIAGADAPIMVLFNALAEAIGEDGLRTTARGNLPRAFCRTARDQYPSLDHADPIANTSSVNRENDFPDLHVTRVVAQTAGLIRKYKGRFLLTRKARRLETQGGIYPLLLTTHATRFNWGYSDRYPELDFVQQAFAFTLYLLHHHGAAEHKQHFYEDAFLRAFPTVLESMEPEPFLSTETTLRQCYRLRTLSRFAGFLGLARLEWLNNDILNPDIRITKTPLLDAAVRFDLG